MPIIILRTGVPDLARRSFHPARRHLHKFKLLPCIEQKTFFLEIMDGSDFQKNKPQQCNIGIKNEVKFFYFRDHIHTWTVISKKKGLHLVFQSPWGQRLQQFFQIWPFV